MPYRWIRELKATAALALPLMIGHLSHMGMGFTDTLMAGRLSALDLAAVALANSIWLPLWLFVLGLMLGISPTVAQWFGAKQWCEIGMFFRQALWLAIFLGVILHFTLQEAHLFLVWFGVDPSLWGITADYLYALSWGAPFTALWLAGRLTSEGTGHTRVIMYVQLAALCINALADYVLMFGAWGMPAYGAVGAGWSTTVVMSFSALVYFLYLCRSQRYQQYGLFEKFDWPDWRVLFSQLRLNIPIGVAVVMEASLFSGVALLMGGLGAVPLAAHQIAINYASMMFMIPMSLGSALTARIGQAVGAGQFNEARYIGMLGMFTGALLMTFSGLIMVFFPEVIVGAYTRDAIVTELAVSLLFFAALFQIWDGVQVCAAGALRGLKDTAIPGFITVVAYWGVGFPCAWFLGLQHGMGPEGLWVGLLAGLFLAAILLSLRFYRVARYNVAEVDKVLEVSRG